MYGYRYDHAIRTSFGCMVKRMIFGVGLRGKIAFVIHVDFNEGVSVNTLRLVWQNSDI